MKNIRTIEFLPEIFRTPTNKKVLSSTLDQLIQEPNLTAIQGYIGRPQGKDIEINYIAEPSDDRRNYQLEPAVIFGKSIDDVLTYPEILDSLVTKRADVTKHDRLFESEYYVYDPFIDLDKFINFGQYYWVPDGLSAVDVSDSAIPSVKTFTVTRANGEHFIDGAANGNPNIKLLRGGQYKFVVSQPGFKFWIQSEPGDGTAEFSSNISTRNVFGVDNNGEQDGEIIFNVPARTAQQYYHDLPERESIDLIAGYQIGNRIDSSGVRVNIPLTFSDINGVRLDVFIERFGGIDGITELEGKTVVFLTRSDGWEFRTRFDNPNDTGYDSQAYDQSTPITNLGTRYGVWRIEYEDAGAESPYLKLVHQEEILVEEKWKVLYGAKYSNKYFYKDQLTAQVTEIPLLTASLDVLYYQDETNIDQFGSISIYESELTVLDVNSIIGKKYHTFGNGVELTNGLKIRFATLTSPANYSGNEYFVEGVGESITFIPVELFVTPERYITPNSIPYDTRLYDSAGFDGSLNEPKVPDYILINRASRDLNPWTRTNRWAHIDVMRKTAEYNQQDFVLDQEFRAKRPIIEFKPNLQLFNFGQTAKRPVEIFDLDQTDALSNVRGSSEYVINGYPLETGMRIIFAADTTAGVRNKIFTVNMIDPDNSGNLIIDLLVNEDDNVSYGDTTVILLGQRDRGVTYWFDGENWKKTQQKTNLNQPPLFDIVDQKGYSFGDLDQYPSTTFAGNKLFGYAEGVGNVDPVLLFPLKYRNIGNIGDIEFRNYLASAEFRFLDGSEVISKPTQLGFVPQHSSASVNYLNGWVVGSNPLRQKQVFVFEKVASSTVVLDVPVPVLSASSIRVTVDDQYIPFKMLEINVSSDATFITLPEGLANRSTVVVKVVSDVKSNTAYYEVPLNLERNPFNESPLSFTLGNLRAHYQSIIENLSDFVGTVNGPNNSRDLGNITPNGELLIQHSAPVVFAASFLRDSDSLNFFDSLKFASQEYEKFKAQLIDSATKQDFGFMEVPEIFDLIIEQISQGKISSSAFYWTDMCPTGAPTRESKHIITDLSSTVFELSQPYNDTSSNYKSVLVYVDHKLLIKNRDYKLVAEGTAIEITAELLPGAEVILREFESTYGSFIPDTPTKLGLYSAFVPEKFVDSSYVEPVEVIRGHDGSITVAYGDLRDDLLLEFETRIFNNLKVSAITATNWADVMPGAFRETHYSRNEMNDIITPMFLSWLSWNKLEYKSQDFNRDNPWSWNYSSAVSKLGNKLNGHWRGIYKDLYDTDTPHLTPWEMVGLSIKPDWWENRYGPAPYTSNNLVLWEDMRDGVIANPSGFTVNKYFVRPELLEYIPVDESGRLLSPIDVIVQDFAPGGFRKSWTIGDHGPTETAWRRSSSWPFVVQQILALTEPAKYFALNADRDLYYFSNFVNQYIFVDKNRLSPKNVEVQGSGMPKHSYINWIVDYGRMLGVSNSDHDVLALLRNLDVRLTYKAAGFTDKQYLKIFTDRATPGAQTSSSLFPDESYQLRIHKSEPFEKVSYSALLVQRVDDGYAVYGYSNTLPIFEAYDAVPNSNFNQLQVVESVVRYPKDYSKNVKVLPYGHVFPNVESVVQFIVGYGLLLEDRGFVFEDIDANLTVDWLQMAREFVYWAKQGWPTSSLVSLNPGAEKLVLQTPSAVVDSLAKGRISDLILNQNKKPLQSNELVFDRFPDEFSVRCLTDNTISSVDFRLVTFEHVLVFDNKSIFGDLLYDPVTGSRQTRLRVVGTKTANWSGRFEAPGFMFNQENIEEWSPSRYYSKGDFVQYKGKVWSAVSRVWPKEEFLFSDWVESDYNKVKKGLLPNIALKADLARDFYNNKTANLERDADLFAFSLIGFKQRKYLSDVGLDDISQVGVYSEFIQQKGTTKIAKLFEDANINGRKTSYQLKEHWAIKDSEYGAIANRVRVELPLEYKKLTSNQAVVSVYNNKRVGYADQFVSIKKLYSSPEKIVDHQFLPVKRSKSNKDYTLPSAGYVNIADVDFTVFDLLSINKDSELTKNLFNKALIWVAKFNDYDWTVLRSISIGHITRIQNNLNGTATVEFSEEHRLNQYDMVVIKDFNDNANGFYEVSIIPSPRSITISVDLPRSVTVINGSGVVFRLDPQRVATPANAATLSSVSNEFGPLTVWADNDDHWQVYSRNPKFKTTNATNLAIKRPLQSGTFGWSIDQTPTGKMMLVGNPSAFGRGMVHSFVKAGNIFRENPPFDISGLDRVKDFGYSISVGDKWAAIGAPGTNNNRGLVTIAKRENGNQVFTHAQVLSVPNAYTPKDNERFGNQVKLSDNEQWLFVGCPGKLVGPGVMPIDSGDRIFVYRLGGFSEQSFSFTILQGTNAYDFGQHVAVNNEQQVAIIVNGIQQTLEVNYQILGNKTVVFNRPVLRLSTRFVVSNNEVGFEFYPQQTGYAPRVTKNGNTVFQNEFSITYTNEVIYEYSTSVPANGQPYDEVEVNGTTYYKYVKHTRIKGRLVLFNPASNGDVIDLELSSAVTAGDNVRVIRRTYASYTATESGANQFDLSQLIGATSPESVTVIRNGEMLFPYDDYNVDGSTLEIFNALQYSRVDVIAGEHYKLTQVIESPFEENDTQFGAAIATTSNAATIVIGAPASSEFGQNRGAAVCYDRYVERLYVDNDFDLSNKVYDYAELGDVVGVKVNGIAVPDHYSNNPGYTVENNNEQLTVTLHQQVIEGDIVTVEFSKFKEISTLAPSNVSDGARFGTSVALCDNGCSVFIGAPYDSVTGPLSGKVTRFENKGRATGVIFASGETITAGDSIRINGFEVVSSGSTVEEFVADITQTVIPNVSAQLIAGQLVIHLVNQDASEQFNRLTILPGKGSLYEDLEFSVFTWAQDIMPPRPVNYSYFGQALAVSENAATLIISAPNATSIEDTVFDQGVTTFDSRATEFEDRYREAGVMYSYDYLPGDASGSVPGQYALGQQIIPPGPEQKEGFGRAISLRAGSFVATSSTLDMFNNIATGVWLSRESAKKVVKKVGTLVDNITDSDITDHGFTKVTKSGRVVAFDLSKVANSWEIKNQQGEIVDVENIIRTAIYNSKDVSDVVDLDFVDPLHGKILGAARENLDFITGVDPAIYNSTGDNTYQYWKENHVGQYWWDLSTVRFIDYNQNDRAYSTNKWSQIFPGSKVNVYEWVESQVPPKNFKLGKPRSLVEYSEVTKLSSAQVFETRYYFWVERSPFIMSKSNKTLSSDVVASYIENPRGSGIPFAAFVDLSSVALFNIKDYLSDETTLQVEYQKLVTDNNVHREFSFITDGDETSFLSVSLYQKMLDSFSGSNLAGRKVPDVNLPMIDRFGVEFRPRQSMFKDRHKTLEIYLSRANNIIKQFPISEIRSFALLQAEEPLPRESEYDIALENSEEFGYQNFDFELPGTRFLIKSDQTNNGRWSIYQLDDNRSPQLVRVQTYSTRDYWSYEDWYEAGYNTAAKMNYVVQTYAELKTLTPSTGEYAKVNANSAGNWEIYYFVDSNWRRVGLGNGTIQFSSNIWNSGLYGFDSAVFDINTYDKVPAIETRYIIRALNEEILTNDLLIYRNELLILLFTHIVSELKSPDWLIKTSFIDVKNKVRDLDRATGFAFDGQEFVETYINEVKPYHVKIREFINTYSAMDTWFGKVTDFDVPAFYDVESRRFVSPILDDDNVFSEFSSRPNSDPIWQTEPWSDWYQNYGLKIENIVLLDRGQDYAVRPTVRVEGECEVPAELSARINFRREVIGIDILNPGKGYRETPTIIIEGGGGSGAKALAIIKPALVRSFDISMKFDRVNYSSTVIDWKPGVLVKAGDLVRVENQVYRALIDTSEKIFNPANFDIIPAADLKATDRITGYYQPGKDQLGRDLGLLLNGITYPEIKIVSPRFDQNAGFDVGSFDTKDYDLQVFGPEGKPTYDEKLIDASYNSSFLDTYLGTRATDLNADGAGFVDEYNSHAPEELLPGSVFDTLDIKVFTRPGAEWLDFGHGMPWEAKAFVSTDEILLNSFDYKTAATYIVFNKTTKSLMIPGIDYFVNWQDMTLTVNSPDDVDIVVYAVGVGGGNQLVVKSVTGADLNNGVIVDANVDEIRKVVAVVNGTPVEVSFEEAENSWESLVQDSTVGATDHVVLVVLGFEETSLEIALPETQYFNYLGSNEFILNSELSPSQSFAAIVTINGKLLRPQTVVDEWTAEYNINGDRLEIFTPLAAGDIVAIITFGDVSQQKINNMVYVGPSSYERKLTHGFRFDREEFDSVAYDGDRWDMVPENKFPVPSDAKHNRTFVSLNGDFLLENNDFEINDGVLEIFGPVLSDTDVVVIKTFASVTVPEKMAFRLFNDMRGTPAVFRITDNTSTPLASTLLNTEFDVINVVDASALPEPNLARGKFGIVTIGAERILYRERDVESNQLKGLIRGSAGTAIMTHAEGAIVRDKSVGNYLAPSYIIAKGFDMGVFDNAWFSPSRLSHNHVDILEASLYYSNNWYGTYNTDALYDVISFDIAPFAHKDPIPVPLQQVNTRVAKFLRGEKR